MLTLTEQPSRNPNPGILVVPLIHSVGPSLGSHSQVVGLSTPPNMKTPDGNEREEAYCLGFLRALCSCHWFSSSSRHFCWLLYPPHSRVSLLSVKTSEGCPEMPIGKDGGLQLLSFRRIRSEVVRLFELYPPTIRTYGCWTVKNIQTCWIWKRSKGFEFFMW